MLKRTAATLVVIAASILTLFVAPPAAQAGNGDVSTTATFGPMLFSAEGAVRAELRNGKVTFWKNTLDGSRWMVVTAQIRDRSTDGNCAKVRLSSGFDVKWGEECNAVWKTVTVTLGDEECTCGSRLEAGLGRGPRGSDKYSDGHAYDDARAPAGW